MEEQNKIDYDPIKSEVRKVTPKQTFNSLLGFLKNLFSFYDEVDKEQTIDDIKNDIEFTGINVWILICSIVVASIGLINNSPAVIIGAMLISPLMGPIRGIGYALSSNNFKVLITSLKNFGTMVGASVLASFVFYFLYPINDIDFDSFHKDFPELFNRTKPNVLDIAIAFFGGLAGVIAATIKNKSATITVVPGVAIATALMPPLCTVGYGIAVGNWSIFIGSFYLFLLNSVFICLATYIVLQLLNFPKVKYVDPKVERKVKVYVFSVLLLIVIPSVFKFYHIVQESIFTQNAHHFINDQVTIDQKLVLTKDSLVYEGDPPKVILYIDGKYINKQKEEEWKVQLKNYDLGNVHLEIRNQYQKPIDEQQLLNKIIANNDEKIESLYNEMLAYKKVVQFIDEDNDKLNSLNKRILVHFPEIKKLNYGRTFKDYDGSFDTNYVFIVDWKNDTTQIERNTQLVKFINEELKLIYEFSNPPLIYHE